MKKTAYKRVIGLLLALVFAINCIPAYASENTFDVTFIKNPAYGEEFSLTGNSASGDTATFVKPADTRLNGFGVWLKENNISNMAVEMVLLNTISGTYNGAEITFEAGCVVSEFDGRNATLNYTNKFGFTQFGAGTEILLQVSPIVRTITFENADDTQIDSATIIHNKFLPGEQVPTQVKHPQADTDQDNTYSFLGFYQKGDVDQVLVDPTVAPIKSDVTFVAKFETTPIQKFDVLFYNGTQLVGQGKVAKGKSATVLMQTPTKQADENYTYTFSHWADELGNQVSLSAVLDGYQVDNVQANTSFFAVFTPFQIVREVVLPAPVVQQNAPQAPVQPEILEEEIADNETPQNAPQEVIEDEETPLAAAQENSANLTGYWVILAVIAALFVFFIVLKKKKKEQQS